MFAPSPASLQYSLTITFIFRASIHVSVGAATFFTVGTALLTYEVAYWLYRHISETSDEVIAEKNQTTV